MKHCIDCKHCEPIVPMSIIDPLANCNHPTSKVMVAEILNLAWKSSCNAMRLNEDKCGEEGKFYKKKWF
jgi:hypothetical protein